VALSLLGTHSIKKIQKNTKKLQKPAKTLKNHFLFVIKSVKPEQPFEDWTVQEGAKLKDYFKDRQVLLALS